MFKLEIRIDYAQVLSLRNFLKLSIATCASVSLLISLQTFKLNIESINSKVLLSICSSLFY